MKKEFWLRISSVIIALILATSAFIIYKNNFPLHSGMRTLKTEITYLEYRTNENISTQPIFFEDMTFCIKIEYNNSKEYQLMKKYYDSNEQEYFGINLYKRTNYTIVFMTFEREGYLMLFELREHEWCRSNRYEIAIIEAIY